MKQTYSAFLTAGALLLAGVSGTQAATIRFQEGVAIPELDIGSYSGTDNLSLIGGANAGRNYGNSNSLWAGKDAQGADRRILLRFDVSALDGVTDGVTSATLTMTLENLSGSTSGSVLLSLYEVSSANAGWVQGNAGGAFEAGSSAWNYRQSATVNWAGSAGLSTPGIDYVNTVIDGVKTVTTGATGQEGVEVTWSLSAELLERWISGDNAGLLFVVTPVGEDPLEAGDNFRFASSTWGTVAHRPELTVTYEAIPEPATAALLLAGGVLYGAARYRRRQG